MKRKRKINKWFLAYQIAAGLIFLGVVLYSLSFRMRGYENTADTILETLFFVYASVYIARTFYIVNN
jgi:tellurite resistance protein TehA-like permease